MRIATILFLGLVGLTSLASNVSAAAVSWPANGATPVSFETLERNFNNGGVFGGVGNLVVTGVTDAAPLEVVSLQAPNGNVTAKYYLLDGNNVQSQTYGNLYVLFENISAFPQSLTTDVPFSYYFALKMPRTTNGQYISGVEFFGGDQNLFNASGIGFNTLGQVSIGQGAYTIPANSTAFYALNFTTIPEPSSILLLLGTGAYFVSRRRRV